MADVTYTRADILILAQKNPCLFQYNFWALGAAAFTPIAALILAFSPPSTWALFVPWFLLLLLSGAASVIFRYMLVPQPMAAAMRSLIQRKPAIWVTNNTLHFFDQVVAIEQVDYLRRQPKYGFGTFELHLIDGRQQSHDDAFIYAFFAGS